MEGAKTALLLSICCGVIINSFVEAEVAVGVNAASSNVAVGVIEAIVGEDVIAGTFAVEMVGVGVFVEC